MPPRCWGSRGDVWALGRLCSLGPLAMPSPPCPADEKVGTLCLHTQGRFLPHDKHSWESLECEVGPRSGEAMQRWV